VSPPALLNVLDITEGFLLCGLYQLEKGQDAEFITPELI
jgi:hypothetical protein